MNTDGLPTPYFSGPITAESSPVRAAHMYAEAGDRSSFSSLTSCGIQMHADIVTHHRPCILQILPSWRLPLPSPCRSYILQSSR